MEGDFNPGAKVENQGEDLANSFFVNPLPLQHGHGEIGSLHLRIEMAIRQSFVRH